MHCFWLLTPEFWYKCAMPDHNEIYRDLLDNLADGVYFTDLEGRITYWNSGAERLSGFSPSEVLGKRCRENLLMHVDASGLILCTSECPLMATIRDGLPRDADIFLHHKDGSRLPIHIRVAPLKSHSGAIMGAVEVFSDNTAKAQMAERLAQLEQLALLDPLTGLPNRRHLESHVYSRLEEFRRDGWAFGILFIDVDDFKLVNDRYGHDTGDRVLKMVARTLNANSRYFDIVGRWGGEEFLGVIYNVDQRKLQEISERWRLLVEQSVLTDADSLRVTISIGASQVRAGDTADSVLRRADSNLYKAKQSGKNRVCMDDQQ
jgi:diguanylate cyclase (GGDEF)-like protein/PAS domain S-box-containing protein